MFEVDISLPLFYNNKCLKALYKYIIIIKKVHSFRGLSPLSTLFVTQAYYMCFCLCFSVGTVQTNHLPR